MGWKHLRTHSSAASPLVRMTARAAPPGAEATATIVSSCDIYRRFDFFSPPASAAATVSVAPAIGAGFGFGRSWRSAMLQRLEAMK